MFTLLLYNFAHLTQEDKQLRELFQLRERKKIMHTAFHVRNWCVCAGIRAQFSCYKVIM